MQSLIADGRIPLLNFLPQLSMTECGKHPAIPGCAERSRYFSKISHNLCLARTFSNADRFGPFPGISGKFGATNRLKLTCEFGNVAIWSSHNKTSLSFN